MEVLTDNKNRTVAEIRHLITKYGGNLGENGSVSWMFDKKGKHLLQTHYENPAAKKPESPCLLLCLEILQINTFSLC